MYTNALNHIRLGVKNNKLSINLLYSSRMEDLIKVFIRIGVILSYKVKISDTNNHIKYAEIILNQQNKNCDIITISKPSAIKTIKHKDIIVLNNRTTASTYVLSTSTGIITLKEAESLKIGGILLAKIY